MTTSSPRRSLRRPGVLVLAPGAAVVLAISGCGGGSGADDGAATASEVSDGSERGVALELFEGWVKTADSGMTAVFGTLVNDGDQDVVLTGGETSVAGVVEMHEMAMGEGGSMTMRPKEGGIVVPARGEYVLGAGGDHVMLRDLTTPVAVGDDVTVTLTTADGDTVDITASGRDFAGANETYDPAGGMDMGQDEMTEPED